MFNQNNMWYQMETKEAQFLTFNHDVIGTVPLKPPTILQPLRKLSVIKVVIGLFWVHFFSPIAFLVTFPLNQNSSYWERNLEFTQLLFHEDSCFCFSSVKVA